MSHVSHDRAVIFANPARRPLPASPGSRPSPRGFHARPGMNRFSSGGRLYQRRGYFLSFAAKKRFDDKAALVTVKVEYPENEPFIESIRKVKNAIGEGRGDALTTVDKERQLQDALMLGDPITELTIVMEVNYFQLNSAEYYVPVVAKIPGSELALARRRGAEHTLIDFIGEVKDEYNVTVANVRDKVDIKLSGATAAQLSRQPIQYDTGFTLLPGKYVIKYLVRDSETGRIGTYQTSFTIPNLVRDDKRVPISSVVLASQRVPVGDALFSVQQKLAVDAVNPLVLDGQKLVPSVTRVFSKGRDVYVFLQAYERTQAVQEPLVAFVSFYRGQVKAFETAPLVVTEGLDLKSRAVPLRFSQTWQLRSVGWPAKGNSPTGVKMRTR